ncbi:MAG: 5'-methylthioadenosine/adenosylhomocysteine nucleosidase [Bacteroidaceae bacterium]|nr:5'-methylthioadenosine/adenosylhomocysteine nucleosidase [Bacteroidaceae bacterium]
MKIGILAAMSVEYEQLVRLMEHPETIEKQRLNFTLGRIGPHNIVLMQCGIGNVNAAMGTMVMIHEFQPQSIISTGCAGGIDPALRIMDVVVSSELAYHDVDCGEGLGCTPGQIQGLPPRFPSDEGLVQAAKALQTDVRVHAGLILTGDQFITHRPALDRIKESFPEGMAVDMESAAIAQVCYLQGVPFVSFRVISDTPGTDQHQEQYENFWQTLADRSFGVTRHFLEAIE